MDLSTEVSHIVDLSPENLQAVLGESTKGKVVAVQFWADWSEPCKVLIPILEKLAAEFSQNLILAKVNVDQQQEIAGQFGVRNLPTVAIFKDGQPVDGFADGLGEAEVRSLLAKHLPKPEDALLQSAREKLSAGEMTEAYSLIKAAHESDAKRADIRLCLAEAQLGLGQLAQAEELLAGIMMADQDHHYQSLMAQLELAKKASDTPEIQALLAELETAPESLALQVKLGVAYHASNNIEQALEVLFSVLKKQLDFGDARKLYLDILNTLAGGDPLANRYRTKLYTLLY